MKTLKITLLLALFLTVSSQTDQKPSSQEINSKEAKMQKANQTELNIMAHIVTGIRIPTQG